MMSSDPLSAALDAYREVLGNPGVLPDDDFFELGGDSIQAIDALSLIEEAVGVEVPVVWFFNYPTAAELASAIAAGGGAG